MALSFKLFVLTFCITTPSRTDAADLVIEKFVGQRDMYFGTSGVVTYANISPVSCAVKCKLVGGCLSFGYNSALKRCDIHKSDFGTLMVQQDWVFYNWKGKYNQSQIAGKNLDKCKQQFRIKIIKMSVIVKFMYRFDQTILVSLTESHFCIVCHYRAILQ